MIKLPNFFANLPFTKKIRSILQPTFSKRYLLPSARKLNLSAIGLDVLCIALIFILGAQPVKLFISPVDSLHPLTQRKNTKEVFGFAPYWTFDKLNVDFNVLTTLAYFGVPINEDGSLDREDSGYQAFLSPQATQLFKKAHAYGTRVVLTLTQMSNDPILAVMDNPDAQKNLIDQATTEVTKRGIDGINVDFEFTGDPGQDYRNKFSQFIKNLTQEMHSKVPSSKVTVSVYASAVKDPKIYDIGPLSQSSDGIFMMAYDFAVAGADNAIPTAPLYGYKQGIYWYDVSTAVNDFLTQMPANKLILGVPLYGYNYLVYHPGIKAETLPYYSWKGQPTAQTYATVLDNIKPNADGISNFQTGWDPVGNVGWKAYYDNNNDTWRMIFLDDVRSLGMKFDFAKNEKLLGVGLWALGFEESKKEVWQLLEDKFGIKLVNNTISQKPISEAVVN